MPQSVRLEMTADAEGSGPLATLAFQLTAPQPLLHAAGRCAQWTVCEMVTFRCNRHATCNAPAGLPTFGWTSDKLTLVT